MVKVTDQKRVFKSGNEGAAWAAKQIDFDVWDTTQLLRQRKLQKKLTCTEVRDF